MNRISRTSAASEQIKPTVIIVDDDAGVRQALDSLLRSVDLNTRLFSSPAEMMRVALPDEPGCIVLDVRLPGVSGLEFQGQLADAGISLPIVFMTGHGDIPMTVRAMKAGAVDFLPKPFRDQDMLDSVMVAIDRDKRRRLENAAKAAIRLEFEALTPREREVMQHVAAGLMNKQIAGLIGLSEITVKIHRGNVMRKMAVRSLADLVRKAEGLGLRQDAEGVQTSV